MTLKKYTKAPISLVDFLSFSSVKFLSFKDFKKSIEGRAYSFSKDTPSNKMALFGGISICMGKGSLFSRRGAILSIGGSVFIGILIRVNYRKFYFVFFLNYLNIYLYYNFLISMLLFV